ncbi:sec-independent protein translocase protein TatB [Roseiarcus fermentans]|uniref:Sec-independent protein translocase protein TatB n=1 Tax=Roseiarcus fermentans TaxID=1473586 RepID=A0A366FSC8_9HYPH|nr:twin-arginine translocase TatA/TatE family subunit [Roseiarcus fermentans]RBP17572.1 sec-independent protein translocase protein TatB [Roseiarcus fermentans]
MFDFDLSKMLLVGVVALIVVGPKELPAVMRTLARGMAHLRRLQASARTAVDTFMADADPGSVDREFASLDKVVRTNIALNPATAMRGHLPASGAGGARREVEEETPHYASPEMQAYLAPPAERPALAKGEAAPTPAWT